MTNTFVHRAVSKIESPAIGRGLNDYHCVRRLISPGNWLETDPFLLLMEDWFPCGVFDRHPHRGIEIVTYIIEGIIEHYDNHGNKGTVGPGDSMWLTTGRGVIHNEQPTAAQTVHLLQLWVSLPQADKLVPALLQEILAQEAPVRRDKGAEVRVFSGASGEVISPTKNYAPVMMAEIRLRRGAIIELDLPSRYNGFIVVLEGGAEIGSSSAFVAVGQIAWLTRSGESSAVSLTAVEEGVRAMLIAGLPLSESVAARGPFVINTEEELDEAFPNSVHKAKNSGSKVVRYFSATSSSPPSNSCVAGRINALRRCR